MRSLFLNGDLCCRVNQGQSGQVGVITLLIMAVLLTIGLSTAVNTSQDVELSRQEAESARVFNAAESGVEKALQEYVPGDGAQSGSLDSISDVGVDYFVTELNSLETRLFEGLSVAIDVTGNGGSPLEIEWSREDDCGTQDPASLLAAVFSDDGSGGTMVRYEPIGACDRGDKFETASTINQDGYRRRYELALAPDDLFVRLRPLYNDTHLRITGQGLPTQGIRIRSEAENQLGSETRAVEVTQSLPTAPSVMDYALVSGTNIVK